MTSPEDRPHVDPDFHYVSPYADLDPVDPVEAERAGDALAAIMDRYMMAAAGAGDPQGQMDGFKTMIGAIRTYSQASIRAGAEGLTGDARDAYIKDEMKKDAHIDPEDVEKADADYKIVSEGYDLNRSYWDMHLGRERRYRNTMRDLDEELGIDK